MAPHGIPNNLLPPMGNTESIFEELNGAIYALQECWPAEVLMDGIHGSVTPVDIFSLFSSWFA